MGIEPTGHTVNVRPNGFEDRAQHQLWKRFRRVISTVHSSQVQFCRHQPTILPVYLVGWWTPFGKLYRRCPVGKIRKGSQTGPTHGYRL